MEQGGNNLLGILFGLGAAVFYAAILSYIDPLVAVLVSVLMLGESITLIQMLGGIFILGFTLWNEKSS